MLRVSSFSSSVGALPSSNSRSRSSLGRLNRSSSDPSLRASVELANGRAIFMKQLDEDALSPQRLSRAMTARKNSVCSFEDAKSSVERGSFEIEKAEVEFGTKIGEGATAIVLKATWQGKPCAVKMLKFGKNSETPEYKDLLSELSILTKVGSHRNLVQFFGAQIRDDTCPFIVQELVEGSDLESFLQRKATGFNLGKKVVYRWCLDILSALDYLHDRDPIIMHRDLKPANILLCQNNQVLKLTDFGLAKQLSHEERLNIAHAGYTGTLRYMAPEVLGYFSRTESDAGDWYSKTCCHSPSDSTPEESATAVCMSEVVISPHKISNSNNHPAATQDTFLELEQGDDETSSTTMADDHMGRDMVAVYTEKADIYSASLIMWYLLTGHQPQVDVRVQPRGRPDLHLAKERSLDIAVLLECMWNPCPERRPTAGECLDYLYGLRRGCAGPCTMQ